LNLELYLDLLLPRETRIAKNRLRRRYIFQNEFCALDPELGQCLIPQALEETYLNTWDTKF
jgi:hypothetical protein